MSLGAAKAALLGAAGAGGAGPMDYSAATWDPVTAHNVTLTGGDLIAKVATGSGYGHAQSSLVITGSIYIELSAKRDTGWAFNMLGVQEAGLFAASDAISFNVAEDADGVYADTAIDGILSTYGISYNPSTGALEIREDNVLVKTSNILLTDPRVYFEGGKYSTAAPGEATANFGATAFTYTPVIL